MKLPARTPLLVLVTVGVFSVAYIVFAAPDEKLAEPKRPFHLVIRHVTACDEGKLKTALNGSGVGGKKNYHIKYHKAAGITSEGELDSCPASDCDDGAKTRPNVTQQVSFTSAGELAKFLTDAFR